MPARFGLTLFALFLVAGLVFILHTIGSQNFWYWEYWWFDIIMHFLGGVVLGGCAAWGYFRFETFFRRFPFVFSIVCAVGITGVGWEVFEYATGMFIGQEGVAFDTFLDLVMDLTGALCALYLVKNIFMRTQMPSLV